jgi:amidase
MARSITRSISGTPPHRVADDIPRSSVTLNVLRDVAAKNNITISTSADEKAYLTLLQSADTTVASVNELPDYVDPRLLPVPVAGGERKYWKAEHNSLNGWSHRANLVAERPSSKILQGRSIAIKDNMSVGGLPLTVGTFPQLTSPNRTYPISPIDATIVSRVLQAGAKIIGTSTCENYSCTPLSYTSASGPVHNPWLFNHTVGGSSSGNAAMLSLGLARNAGVPGLDDAGDSIELALGGDQGGSIRLPASFTGVYGLKPTIGLVPYTGIASLHPLIDHCGPMATNLMDIARLLSVIAGYDGLDPRMTPESPLRENVRDYAAELSSFIGRKLSSGDKLGTGMRIGLLTESFVAPGMSDAVKTTVHAAASTCFAASGATIREISVPLHLLGPAIWTAATRGSMAELAVKGAPPDLLSHTMPHWQPRWPPDQEMYDLLTRTNPAVVNLLFWGTFTKDKYSAAVSAKAHRHVLELRAAYDKALEEVDVLITPTAPTVASKHADLRPEAEGGSGVMDKIRLAVGAISNTCPFNATGHPAMSVPCGWGEADGEAGKKLPIGMQIIGKKWDEMSVLKAAAAFEDGGGGLGTWR